MPQSRPRKRSIDYAPELIELLVRGSQERVVIAREDYKTAIRDRHTLHRLRATMRAENHPKRHLVEATVISLRKEPPAIILSPAHETLVQAIRDVGIKPEESVAYESEAEPDYSRPHSDTSESSHEPINPLDILEPSNAEKK